MSTAIRLNNLALDGGTTRTLANAELHGKRLDAAGQERRIRDVPPLTWRPEGATYDALDLRAAYDAHMRIGADDEVRLNAACKKPVQHALVQWPVGIKVTENSEKRMLKEAVDFCNSRFGGDAVFAARLDRDEAGRHTVDVFMTPKYTKTTAKGATEWASTSKFGKALCLKHKEELMRRNIKGKLVNNLKAQGQALQSEWRDHLAGLGFILEPKKEKTYGWDDRKTPEAYGAMRDLEAARASVDTLSSEVLALKAHNAELLEATDKLMNENLALRQGDELTWTR